jgi:hypothetical protein
MPKLSLPDSIANTEAKIEELVSELEYLLEGKVDTDNCYKTGTESIIIPSKKVLDIADSTRPVECYKFFGNNLADNLLFRTSVFDPMITLMDSNRVLLPLELKESFILNSTPEIKDNIKIRQIKKQIKKNKSLIDQKNIASLKPSLAAIRDDRSIEELKEANKISRDVIKDIRSETNTYNRNVKFEIPPNLRLCNGEDIEKIFPNEGGIYRGIKEAYFPFIDVRTGLVDDDDAEIICELADNSMDEVSFNISVITSPLTSTKFINVDVLILALFEVLP